MELDIGKYSVWKRSSELTPAMVGIAEQLGLGSVWAGGSPPGDLEHVEALVAGGDSIPVITGIVNMWRADPHVVAASYHRIQEAKPDRFILGVGIGHREAVDEYESPYSKMVEYLAALSRAGVPSDRLVLAALGPRALQLSAAETLGTHLYFTTPRHTAMARELLGEEPLIAPEQTVVVTGDEEAGLKTARDFASRYLRLENYRNSLLREGWAEADLDDGGSDELVAEVVTVGSAGTVAQAIEAHIDAGADHVAIQILGDGDMSGFRSLAPHLN